MTPAQKAEKEKIQPGLSTSDLASLRNNWIHIPTRLTLAWLLISIPLVIWDTGYVLFRPLSMPGGFLHWPLWVPYRIYLQTDFIYGWKAINDKNGFTAAQGSMNIPETLLYAFYLYLIYTESKYTGPRAKPKISGHRYVHGRPGAMAVMAGFTAAVMTFSKTVLYGLNEAFSGWGNVGHNEWVDLICFYIIPNGAWLVASACMAVEFGSYIFRAISQATGASLTEQESG